MRGRGRTNVSGGWAHAGRVSSQAPSVSFLPKPYHGDTLEKAAGRLFLLAAGRLERSLDVDLVSDAAGGLHGGDVPTHALENSLDVGLIGI